MIKQFTGKNAFLSNFWPCEITIRIGDERVVCPTVEHGYQALKTKVTSEQRSIVASSTPGKAKRAGKAVHMREDWERLKVSIMKQLLVQKFAPGSELAAKLLATGDEELVEGNNWNDLLWGVDLMTGKGQNKLGKLLMEVRAELREGQAG